MTNSDPESWQESQPVATSHMQLSLLLFYYILAQIVIQIFANLIILFGTD